MMDNESPELTKTSFKFERIFRATPLEVWEMWTTIDGLESWFGPDGFTSTVNVLDLWVGGCLEIAMEAIAPGPRAMLEASGQPMTSISQFIFTEVLPPGRLAWTNRISFIPDVAPYAVASSVELHAVLGGTRMIFVSDVMHDDRWTRLASMGWAGSFNRMGNILNTDR